MRHLFSGILLLASFAVSANDRATVERFSLAALKDVPSSRFAALDVAALGVEDIQRDLQGLPPRYAIPLVVDVTPQTQGLWEAAGPDHQVWRYRVQAAEALSINFGFTEFRLPEGAQLYVYSSDLSSRIRPFTHADNESHGQLWTPVLLTSDAVIELTVPNIHLGDYALRLGQVGHGYRGFGEKRAQSKMGQLPATCDVTPIEPETHGSLLASLSGGDVMKMVSGNKSAEKSGSCNMDTQCIAAPAAGPDQFTPWKDNVKAVGVISTGGSTFCTGSLINNTNNDKRMLFVTAAHCTINAGNAASLVVAWNYENSTCRVPGSAASGGPGDGSVAQFNTGSVHLVTNATSDFTLVELDDPANPAHQLYWAGWDKTPFAGAGGPGSGDFACSTAAYCAAIHHPNTDEKRITFVQENTTTTSYNNPAIPGNGSHVHAMWSPSPPIFNIAGGGNTGTSGNPPNVTEGGSSGSPLYNAQRRFIGQLHGGPSACGSTGGNLSDYYGRFSLSFVPAATHLDPTNSGVVTIDGRGECTAPGTPTVGTATATGPNQVQVTWTNGTPASDKYNVYRAVGTCASPGTFTQVGTGVTASPFNDTTVSGGTTYAYQVTGTETTGSCESVQSSCVQVTATGACTLAPTFAGLATAANAATTNCAIDLGWAAGTAQCGGPTTFNLYRSTTSGFTPAVGNRIANALSGTSYNDTDSLTSGTQYFYVARAVDGANSVEDGNTVQRSVIPTGPVSTSNFTETFEGAGGFDNPGWTHQAVTGPVDWTWSTAQNNTPTHSWFSDSQTAVSTRVLTTPSFGVIPTTTLSFFHTFAFETNAQSRCFDAGTLEVSTNGGTVWTVMPDANFTAGGFNGTVDAGFQNPLAGKRAWCAGTVGTMTQVSVNLASFAGQNIMLRWNEGDDSSAEGTGWFVDSVSIANAGTASACGSGPPALIFGDGFE
jgi:lysyl endopeptidase